VGKKVRQEEASIGLRCIVAVEHLLVTPAPFFERWNTTADNLM